ncbi:MAG: MFS transporter [Deltaproteobacteria bacterium]|nr:MFS transporter [Deltaproteobacteria bacterium]
MTSSIHVALPSIQKELSADAVLLSWTVMSYILSSSILLVPFGKLADIYGRKRLFFIGMAFFAFTTFLCGIANSILMLIFMRILQGISASIRISTGSAMVVSAFPPEERGKALGISAAATYAGMSSGPSIGGILTQYFGWRSVFLFAVPLTLATLFIGYFKLKGEWADAKNEHFDLRGSIFYVLGLALIFYGATCLPELYGIWIICFGLISFGFFLFIGKRTENPVLETNIFVKNRVFLFSCIALCSSYISIASAPFLLSLYLQYIKGFSAQTTGFILLGQPLIQTLFSPIAGRLSDRIEPGIIASVGMSLTSISLIFLIFINYSTSVTYILFMLFLIGIGYGLFSSPNSYAVMSAVEKRYYGVASGILATMRTIGMSMSMTITTILFSLFIGRNEIGPVNYPELLTSVKIAFSIGAFFCILGIFFSSSRGSVRLK